MEFTLHVCIRSKDLTKVRLLLRNAALVILQSPIWKLTTECVCYINALQNHIISTHSTYWDNHYSFRQSYVLFDQSYLRPAFKYTRLSGMLRLYLYVRCRLGIFIRIPFPPRPICTFQCLSDER